MSIELSSKHGLKARLKQSALGVPLLRGVFAIRTEWLMDRFFARIGLRRLERKFQEAGWQTVLSGPFRGLQYVKRAAGSVWFPKVVGCYELELHGVVEEAIALQPDLLVDIGAAEGYYAAGFAMRLPDTRVVAGDTNPLARRRSKALCKLNGLETRVEVTGLVTSEFLEEMLSAAKRPVVWCDIEGGEFELLNPKISPNLQKAWICFESHEGSCAWSIEEILERFTSTHLLERIAQQTRTAADFETFLHGRGVSQADAMLLVSELRSNIQEWIVLRPKDSFPERP